jgi:iron(III) transport system ATP-binding protein
MSRLVLKGLTKAYGAQTVVDSVDLSLAEGEFVSLLGPSGCGKTTTLRMIAGFVEPNAGTIEMDGKRLSEPGAVLPPERRGMSMIFQSYAIWPNMTVAENVAFGLKLRKLPSAEVKRRVGEILDVVQMGHLAGRYPSELSGGQQQRVALARALVYRPRVLLLDEPFGALDRKLREEMQVELRLLVRRLGLTTIMVTHDQEEALTLADRLAVMERGRLMQVGTGTEVYDRPASRFVADFMGVANLLEGRVVDAAPDLVQVEVAGGVRLAAVPPGAPPLKGSLAAVAIRPEALALDPAGSIPGTVEQAIFKGQSLDVWVGTPAGRLLVRLDRAALAAAPEPGAPCALRVAPSRAILLPREIEES